jgi:hypothetical protein
VLATLRMTRRVTDGFFAAADLVDVFAAAGLAVARDAVSGFTRFGAAFPKGFFVSFERAEAVGFAAAFAWVALLLVVAFLAVVAMALTS